MKRFDTPDSIDMSTKRDVFDSPDFVGFALKTLEEPEYRQMESFIGSDPKARRIVERIQRLKSPLDADRKPIKAPSGLARKTILHVRTSVTRSLPAAPPLLRDPEARSRTWGLRTDLFAAAGLLIMFGGVIWPAIHRQRQNQADLACRYNMSQTWRGLVHWAMNNGDKFPVPDEKGARSTPGIYASCVIQSGYVLPQSYFLDCPSTVENPTQHQVPTLTALDDLYRTDRDKWHETTRQMGGSYAYHMGHRIFGHHVGYNLKSGGHRPILADAGHSRAGHNSPNHGDRGQNVLTIGGSVRFWNNRNAGIGRDDIYLNRTFAHNAGIGPDDTVLGSWADRPCSDAD